MATKDYKKNYSGIRDVGGVLPVDNTVSRDLSAGDKSFESVIWQSGKPILDSELEIHQDATRWENRLYRAQHMNSGWLRGQSRDDGYLDYTTVDGSGVSDDSGATPPLIDGTTLVNSFILPKLTALVAGRMVVIEYTNTETEKENLIQLPEPRLYATGITKRTDFVWLEVWLALVAPSPPAVGSVQVVDADPAVLVTGGAVITINGVSITATLTNPAPVGFFTVTPNDEVTTASNIVTAINDPANGFDGFVVALANADTVQIQAVVAGAVGNAITLSATTVGLLASGVVLQDGADRPNKPTADQSKLFRHGNTQSPESTWLDDEIVDPVVNQETAQRVQVQYRFRYSDEEDINYKTHPDGFSNGVSGDPTTPLVIAQGPRSTPALSVGGSRTYPFVPADQESEWLESSALAYAIKDNGLWVSGDGSTQSVEDLGTLDGYIYAIPLCFAFRHNDVSSIGTAAEGFDPDDNSNGAPCHDHLSYDGPLGVIGAGLSDRPDGEFADVITQNNLLDLRRSIVPPGIDLTSELQYQIQSLLDANNQTWAIDSYDKHAYSGTENGDVSTRCLVCDTIGRTTSQAGEHTRDFDHVSRRFGDNPIIERVVFSYWPGDRVAAAVPVTPGLANDAKYVTKAGGSVSDVWTEGDVLHLDLANFDTGGLGSFFQGGSMGGLPLPWGPFYFTDVVPPGTVISDVLSIYHDDGNYNVVYDQQVEASSIRGIGTSHLEIHLDANDTPVTGGLNVAEYPMVDRDVTFPGTGSQRRIFIEVEISYPIGDELHQGLTDTPLLDLTTPDEIVYNTDPANSGTVGDFLPGPGNAIVVDQLQAPADTALRNPPGFREGFREVRLDYVTDATDDVTLPDTDPVFEEASILNPLGGLVSRNKQNVYTPRRLYGEHYSSGGGYPTVYDVPAAVNVNVDYDLTEYGSSSRKIVLETANLSGVGNTLCDVEYYPQDPIPNYGDAGYSVMIYYRAAAPQTAGVIDGIMDTDNGGTVPTELSIEPLAISPHTWTSQVGMGSTDAAFPYASPLDQIPIMEGKPTLDTLPTIGEWHFCASAMVTIDDFNTDTGMLALQSMIQADQQPTWTLGGDDAYQKPYKDNEFRALYPYVTGLNGYRPTIMAQPLFGSTRHKVFVPVLARVKETVPGALNGILFRQDELVLVVLTRFAELDEDNHIRFVGGLASDGSEGDTDAYANRTCAAVYRTRNLLLTVGGR